MMNMNIQCTGDTTWNIQDSSGTILIQRGPYGLANTLHEEYYCDITTDEKTFTIFDSFGDGIVSLHRYSSYNLHSTIVDINSFMCIII